MPEPKKNPGLAACPHGNAGADEAGGPSALCSKCEGQSWGRLRTLTVELAVRMSSPPSGGLLIELLRRTSDLAAIQTVHVWEFRNRCISVPEFEDITTQLALLVGEHLIHTAGLQLVLHD